MYRCSYAVGCNKTANAGGGSCAERFKSDWMEVYKTHHTPAIQHLKWCALHCMSVAQPSE